MSEATFQKDAYSNVDMHRLKQEVIDYAHEIGIDKIRFTSAEPFETLKQRLVQHRENGYESGFEHPDIEERTNPKKLMPQAKSIIAIALAYPSKMNNPPRSKPGAYRGMMCRSSWGVDYHHILRKKLALLEQFLHGRVPRIKTELMVDTGALSDRAVAERAGIGWSAKNCAVITPEFGSWVYLGEMLTSLPFEPDQPITQSCGSCTRCIDACPTGALVQGGQLNAQKCIAYLTQVKGDIPKQYRSKIGNRLYGCDTCQSVCPENKGKHFSHHAQMQPDPEVAKPLLKPILEMSNRQFKETFGFTAAAWRGKKPIQRNAIIALAHFKDQSAVPKLKELLQNDPRPVIRATCAWALGQIMKEEACPILREARTVEENDQVIKEMDEVLEMESEVQGGIAGDV